MFDNFKGAISSIASNKVRSVLTVLGVVIGVASVTTLVSLGVGLKNDVSGLIEGFGSNVLFIISGKIDTSSGSQTTNPANFVSGDILTLDDVTKIENLEHVSSVVPISLVPGVMKFNDKTAAPAIFGTYPNFTDVLSIIPVEKGGVFHSSQAGNEIVLGHNPAEQLFGTTNPVGREITIGQETFKVLGVFGKTKSSSLVGSEYDNVAIIPFDTATQLNKNKVTISRIGIRADETANMKALKQSVHDTLLENHDGEENFTVLSTDDFLDLFTKFVNLATTMVSAIASISLIVGGIGIMNIMLVTVTERTREIGLRKAVGATKLAILSQFLTEAIMVTIFGALIGLGIAYTVGAIIASLTELRPAITIQTIALAVGISIIIGIIFGLWPALRAANKDPIEALRYE